MSPEGLATAAGAAFIVGGLLVALGLVLIVEGVLALGWRIYVAAVLVSAIGVAVMWSTVPYLAGG